MKHLFVLVPVLIVCLLCLLGCAGSPRESLLPTQQAPVSGNVLVSAPTGSLFVSSVHYVASATTTCPQGVSAMNIYTAPSQLSYSVGSAKLDTTLVLPPGTYDTVVQAVDNCNAVASQHVSVTVQAASTTLAAETANNTSTADTFQTQTNSNMGASNISKVDIHSLLYSGSTTDIYAELQPWFGDKRHMHVGYISWDPVQVDRQLEDMVSRGVTGVIIDWYGPADPTEPTILAWLAAAASHPGFKIIIMIDKGAIALSPCPGCDPQQTLIYLTNYVLQHYATSPSYATLNGKPIITQFDLDLFYTLDWPAVQAATSPNIAWIFENTSGFTHSITSGSWSWVHSSDAADYAASYLTKFYDLAAQYPDEMAWGVGFKGFNDTLASWSKDRIMDQQCGQTWLQTVDRINDYYNSGKQLPILQLATWNDYEEGTELESGIDNCLTVSASMSGAVLQWSVNGNENTVDHYIVYYSPDGQSLLPLSMLPPGSRSLDVSSYNPGPGFLYIHAIGRPSIKNQMSNAVKFGS